jgi:hypothetical protein
MWHQSVINHIIEECNENTECSLKSKGAEVKCYSSLNAIYKFTNNFRTLSFEIPKAYDTTRLLVNFIENEGYLLPKDIELSNQNEKRRFEISCKRISGYFLPCSIKYYTNDIKKQFTIKSYVVNDTSFNSTIDTIPDTYANKSIGLLLKNAYVLRSH